MQLYTNDSFFQGFCIEGCFSWYDKSLDLCFEIIDNINKNLVKIKIIKPFLLNSKLINYEKIIANVKDKNKERYKYFVELFGDIRFSSLPDKVFYKFLCFQFF